MSDPIFWTISVGRSEISERCDKDTKKNQCDRHFSFILLGFKMQFLLLNCVILLWYPDIFLDMTLDRRICRPCGAIFRHSGGENNDHSFKAHWDVAHIFPVDLYKTEHLSLLFTRWDVVPPSNAAIFRYSWCGSYLWLVKNLAESGKVPLCMLAPTEFLPDRLGCVSSHYNKTVTKLDNWLCCWPDILLVWHH